MKILIISFYDDTNMMYPHLKTVITHLRETENVDYFKFSERGYSFAQKFKFKWFKRVFRIIKKDMKALKCLLKNNNYDKVIAIDHFTYIMTRLLVSNSKLIFWSFDIMGKDSTYYQFFLVRLILKINSFFVKQHADIIIQSEERLGLLEKTLNFKADKKHVCYLPVFIDAVSVEPAEMSIKKRKPVLLQLTSFDGCRYTNELLEQYQQDDFYTLMLHGLFVQEVEKDREKYKKFPLISSELVEPLKVYEVVKKIDMGFIGVNIKEDNCKYLYYTSGQVLEFLRLGKPVIAMGPNNLGSVLEEHKAGKEIFSMEELQNAIRQISDNYDEYSQNALALFKKDFDSKKIMKRLLEFIK